MKFTYMKISEFATVITGGTPKTDVSEYWTNGNIPWLPSGECKDCEIFNAPKYITQAGLDSSAAKLLPKNTVLIALTGTTAGKTGILRIESTANQSVTGILPNDTCIPEYLFYFLQHRRDKTLMDCYGGAQPHISQEYVKNIVVPIPSITEQKAIVKQIEQINIMIQETQNRLNWFDELVKSRFVELFENGDYPVIRLGDACTKITDGTHKTPTYLESGITFISAKNIVNGELDFSDVKHISEEEYAEIQKRCQTEIGDILLSKSGSLGSPVIVKTTQKLGLFESLAVIKYDRNRLLPEFLCEQLKTDRIQRQFKVGTKGVAIKHLHLGVIADTGVIVPSLEEQKQFAAFVEQTDKSKLATTETSKYYEELKSALMNKYFN